MITGAARAEAALLVIDAAEGVQENSRRHGYMMSMLGIRQLAVVVNKMDLVGWDRGGLRPDRPGVRRVPRPGRHQAGLPSSRSRRAAATTSPPARTSCPGTRAPTVLDALDAVPERAARRWIGRSGCRSRTSTSSPSRATTAASSPGTIDSGAVQRRRHGDLLSLGQEEPGEDRRGLQPRQRRPKAEAGWAVGFTLQEQIYITRGELATRGSGSPGPQVTTRLRVSLFWLGKDADGEAEGVPPQARHGAGDLRGSRRSTGSWTPRRSAPPSSGTRSSATMWPSACSSSTAPSPATSPRTSRPPAAS